MHASLIRRLAAYARERFPPGQFVLLSSIIGAVVSLWSQREFSDHPAAPAPVIVSSLALFLFLLRLRLFDEFKDADHDRKHYPERPVPRGLVTLGELRGTLILVVILEGALVAWHARGIVPFLAAFGYSWLMFREFYVGSWLRRHFGIYIFTHELLAFPLAFHVAAMSGPVVLTMRTWLLGAFVTCVFFLLEVARKVRGRGVAMARDTYGEHYGSEGEAALMACAAVAIVATSAMTVGAHGTVATVLVVDGAAFIAFAAFLLRHLRERGGSSAKAVFGAACAFAVVTCGAFILGTLRS